MIYALVFILMGILNHIAGGAALLGLSEFFTNLTKKLIGGDGGRFLYWVTPFVFLVSMLVLSPLSALQMAATFFVWRVGPWAHWFTLGRMPPDFPNRPLGWFEKIVNKIGFGNVYACFTIRNFICALPLALFSPWFLFYAPLQTILYEIGWRIAAYLKKDSGIPYSEVMTGLLWGVIIILASIL